VSLTHGEKLLVAKTTFFDADKFAPSMGKAGADIHPADI